MKLKVKKGREHGGERLAGSAADWSFALGRLAGGAEEDFFEIRVARLLGESASDFLHGAVNDFAAILEDKDMRTDFLDEMQQVRADNDRRAVARAFEDGIFHSADANRIEASKRFIEIDDPGRMEKAASNRKLLFHAT